MLAKIQIQKHNARLG